MGRIIDPNAKAPTLQVWLDAFTCIQECAGDAADNSYIKKEVDDNLKMLQDRVKHKTDPQAQKLLETQAMIKRQMWAQRPELHRELMKLWREVASEIKSYEWDLTQDVHYAESHKGGPFYFWQGDPEERDPNKKQTVTRPKTLLIIRFLKFVRAESETKDPVEYTKNVLLRQGITQQNFHLYADMLAIPNPWTAR